MNTSMHAYIHYSHSSLTFIHTYIHTFIHAEGLPSDKQKSSADVLDETFYSLSSTALARNFAPLGDIVACTQQTQLLPPCHPRLNIEGNGSAQNVGPLTHDFATLALDQVLEQVELLTRSSTSLAFRQGTKMV